MGNVGAAAVSVIAAVIGLALVAVLVSQKAQTGSVISSAGNALAAVIGAATGPVTGQTTNQFGSLGNNIGGISS